MGLDKKFPVVQPLAVMPGLGSSLLGVLGFVSPTGRHHPPPDIIGAKISGLMFGWEVQMQEPVHFSALGEHTAVPVSQGSIAE